MRGSGAGGLRGARQDGEAIGAPPGRAVLALVVSHIYLYSILVLCIQTDKSRLTALVGPAQIRPPMFVSVNYAHNYVDCGE